MIDRVPTSIPHARSNNALRNAWKTPLIVALLVLPSACDMGGSPFASSERAQVAYRPQEAGTVDHALCLLGYVHVPVRNVRPGHQLVEASVNGVAGNFVLDTGANLTVVSASQAERFRLSPRALGVLGSGSARFAGIEGMARQVRVESFLLSDVDIRQRSVLIADLDQLLGPLGRASGSEISGIIGQDILNNHRAIIDVARPMLYLMKEDREPAPVSAESCTRGA
jgi:predicted aspartyl protease